MGCGCSKLSGCCWTLDHNKPVPDLQDVGKCKSTALVEYVFTNTVQKAITMIDLLLLQKTKAVVTSTYLHFVNTPLSN